MEKGRNKMYRLPAAVLAGFSCLAISSTVTEAAAQTNAERIITNDEAGRQLQQAEAQVRKPTGQAVAIDDITVPVTEVKVAASSSLSAASVRSLLPELNKDKVNIRKLSREIQLVNDTGAAKLGSVFTSNHDGSFSVKVANEANKNDYWGISFANTGNTYSGDWRSTVSYVNNNISKRADSLGIAYATSPDKHFSDVKQAAMSYRLLLPDLGGALLANYSYSDIDLGNIAPSAWNGLFDYMASGKGTNAGLHYQQYLAYTSREKDILDFGLDYRRSKSCSNLAFSNGSNSVNNDNDYSLKLISVGFKHNNRDMSHSFTYEASVNANINGDEQAFLRNSAGSDKQFTFAAAGVSYQLKSANDWIMGVRAQGQFTNNHLVGMAQLGAGGMYSVRGFDNSVISADRGLVANLEIYTPEVLPNSRFVAFADYGNMINNVNAQTNCFGHEHLASVGLGYRYTNQASGVSLSVDYAKVVDDLNEDVMNKDLGHRRWNAMLSVNF